MTIHTMKNPYHCYLCAKKSIYRSRIKSHARENLNPCALCEREVMSYQGTTQRDAVKELFNALTSDLKFFLRFHLVIYYSPFHTLVKRLGILTINPELGVTISLRGGDTGDSSINM